MAGIKRRMTYPPTVAIFVAVILLLALMTGVSADKPVPPWPDCDFASWGCHAKEVNTVTLSLEIAGNGSCQPGEDVSANITATIDVNPGSGRYGAYFIGELYVDDVHIKSIVTCIGDILLSGSHTYVVETITWPCGADVEVRDVLISWTTHDDEDCGNSTCEPPRQTKCDKFGTMPATYTLDITTQDCCTLVKVNDTENYLPYYHSFPAGTIVGIEGVDEECCNFVSWGSDATGLPSPTTITMDGNKTVTVNCEVLTSDLTVISDGCCPIDVDYGHTSETVPADGNQTFYDIPCGTNVTLDAITGDCCDFDNWTGGVNDHNSASTFVTVYSNETVTDNCTKLGPYDLTVISDGCCPIHVEWDTNLETVPANGNDTFTIDCGTDVTVSANDTEASRSFQSWSDGGVQSHIIHMDGNKSVTATCITPTPTPVITPPPIGGGGGGGGGWPDMCPKTFTANFNGKITKTSMTADGVLCGNCYAPSPDGMHLFEIDFLTRVLDSEGNPVSLIDITEVHSPDPPPYTVFVGDAYDFAPSGVTFDKQVRLTLGYNVDELPADALRVLMTYYGSEEVWTELETESKQVADIGTLTGFFNHLTIFATLAEVPGFEVSNLSVAPSRREIWPFLTFAAVTGEEAVVSVDVANVGDHEASRTVSLEVNGVTKANHDVGLTPGQNKEVVFVFSNNEPGRHLVLVEGLTGEFTHSLWINWWLIIGILAGLAIIIVLAFYGVRWYMRRVVA